MHIEQSIIHKEYLYHLYNLFLDYCKSREEVVDLLLDQGAAARPLRLIPIYFGGTPPQKLKFFFLTTRRVVKKLGGDAQNWADRPGDEPDPYK